MPRFTPEFLDELKSRLRPSDVIGRTVTLKKQGNEFAGLSPFTKEKTPSFFVNDNKGFYHCFSSGKHGDIISFLQETQNLQFHEAVAMLAADAGLELPQDTPADARREEQRKGLVEACTAAQDFFHAMLDRSQGRKALLYVQDRGISREQIAEFGIGFAPSERSVLKDHLINKGFTEDVLVEAGLLIRPEDHNSGARGGTYDKFRDRVMFPIRNPRGQVIAFGGRALNPDARAKYMNSSETPLFHKGGVLYRYGEARTASGSEKKPLIVCEGYMDVVALWGAGLKTGVAPLGTALTEDQLALLWRINDEPILCFDGDGAGRKAAFRAIERALPMLKPGKSLRFAFLPEGQDPDDLLRDKGRSAMDDALAAAKPFVDVLWLREQQNHDLTTPERRAAFKASLRTLVKSIADRDVRDFYAEELKKRLGQQFGASPSGGGGSPANRNSQGQQVGQQGGWQPSPRASWVKDRKTGRMIRKEPPATVSSELKQLTQANGRLAPNWRREATLCLALVHHPGLIERREASLLRLDLSDRDLSALLRDILACFSSHPGLDSLTLKSHLQDKVTGNLLERLLNDRALNSQSFLKADAQSDEVDWGFDTALSHHVFETDLKEELTRTASRIFSQDNRPNPMGDHDDMSADGLPDDGEPAQDAAPSDDDEPNRGKGDEAWKQTAAAREELFNRHRASSRSDANGASSSQLDTALDRMKVSVSKTSRH